MVHYGKLDIRLKRRCHRLLKDKILEYKKNEYPYVLDVGCASGVIGRLLGYRKNIYGIDNDTTILKKAKNNCEAVYSLDLEKLDLKEVSVRKFDIIVCSDIIEHLKNGPQLLKLLKKRLKDDGVMIISLPNIAQIIFRVRHLMGEWEYEERGILDRNHVCFYTASSAQEMIKASGYEIMETLPSGTIVSYINILPKLLASQFIFVCRKNNGHTSI